MVNQITAKKCETIYHIKVPKELLQVVKSNNSSTKYGYKQGPQAKKINKDQLGTTGGEPNKPRVMHPWST